MKLVFISLPMSGLERDKILDELCKARAAYLCRTTENLNSILFVDNLDCQPPDVYVKHDRIWYLGNALRALSKCDEVFFYGKWKEAPGCRIEHQVCEEYGILYKEEK